MNVPVIGVVPLFDFVKSSVWMIPGYIDGLDEAGAAPVILPYTCGEPRALPRIFRLRRHTLYGRAGRKPRAVQRAETARLRRMLLRSRRYGKVSSGTLPARR